MKRFSLIFLAVFLLSACSEGVSIYHLRSVEGAKGPKSQPEDGSAAEPGKASFLTVDAKQRSILINNKLQMCAEASPDVFAAISATAALEADVASKSGKASGAIAETVGSIERTQTINLLRESMYRTCERFLNGGIGPAQLVVQAARDQRAMIKILAIEQLTRTARPPSTILSGAPVSATVVDGDTAAALIKDFAKERTAAKKALEQSNKDVAKARTKGNCDTVTDPPADDTAKPKLSDWTECKVAEAANTERKKEFDAASARLDKALAVAEQLKNGASGSVAAGPISDGAGGSAIDSAAIQRVAAAVETIVKEPDIDEPLMFCISFLGPDRPDAGGALVKDGETAATCRGILKARAQKDDVFRSLQQGIQIQDFAAALKSPKIRSLNTYLTKPPGSDATASNERKRRIEVVIKAAKALNIRLTPPDVSDLATSGDPSLVEAIIDQVLAIETTSARQDLAN